VGRLKRAATIGDDIRIVSMAGSRENLGSGDNYLLYVVQYGQSI
jgi:hypothetical protein